MTGPRFDAYFRTGLYEIQNGLHHAPHPETSKTVLRPATAEPAIDADELGAGCRWRNPARGWRGRARREDPFPGSGSWPEACWLNLLHSAPEAAFMDGDADRD